MYLIFVPLRFAARERVEAGAKRISGVKKGRPKAAPFSFPSDHLIEDICEPAMYLVSQPCTSLHHKR